MRNINNQHWLTTRKRPASSLFVRLANKAGKQIFADQDTNPQDGIFWAARSFCSCLRRVYARVMANFTNQTLAKKSVGFSVCRIQNFGGQDKRSAVGCSMMVGFLRFIERRFLEAAALASFYSMISMLLAPSPVFHQIEENL